MKPIWIVDDDPSIRFVLEKALAREDLPTRSFSHPREVLEALADVASGDDAQQGPQVLVSDIRMPGGSGLQLLEKVREREPGLPVIIMTAYSDLDSAVSAFQRGAFEYLPKPFDLNKAVELIRRAVEERQREEVVEDGQSAAPEMLGQAPAMQDVFRAIGRLSQSQVTVLITGESGTGKELVARALHKHSPVAGGPFVAINTAAIPKDLLESELFGHERGAFTGAQTQRRGRFEQAEGGTLFLDEIGDMPFDLQTRLLRVLSDGQFYRVGGHAAVKVRVRVIAATHQDLERRVKEGAFREDLFHRLNVIRLRLPPLRERREDIPMLTRHFLQHSARQLGVEPKRISDAALARLQQFAFPGNVRQLENICHWLTVMAPAQVISVQDLPPEVLEAPALEAPASAPAAASGAATLAPTTAAPAAPVAPVAAAFAAPPSPAPLAASTPAGAWGMAAAAVPLAAQPASVNGTRAAAAEGAGAGDWERWLEAEAQKLLASGHSEVWDALTRRFESRLIRTALAATHGRRMEAAQRLGIGRNTITRKIQELGLDAPPE
ncbi:nitrogen regulation protein NR(I) [Extensimonas vulgaris]|uniref:DNA-binding transcriptional regulator NtrC n=1 Tax=Extensimonas vulgaris TaxID=1031594 RepID=A0A369AU23_9BURK|nr:nitrogen regulation protein NR(I) [Extensimonas vulgaris]RCX11756.1 two-component system nitrogen regulation response regulator GlnG [Extensimonas vulgaris]TWI40650.1 two-component system nitrogen regulation response regulator GlnG [Extensimonas vulgaris]TXD15394.1 nitrogen regulation protein NR(I) [Extensimonas vulgaris]